MDSFSFNNLQAEKANAMLKHRRLRRIANLLRLVEVCVVLLFISRLSLQLPLAVRNSSELFRDFTLFMNTPRFVFLIGNLIIITLFAQSGQFSVHGSAKNETEPDLYQDLVHKNTKIQGDPEKQGIIINSDVSKNKEKVIDSGEGDRRIDTGESKLIEKPGIETGEAKVKSYRRCETEILSEKRCRLLRRCETEKRRENTEQVPRISYPEDGMSNEEFRRTVEAFIAKQQRIRREEDYYLV
ncbi:hypothetical protein RJT34_31882 [Clitoria ternatea]|uniref:DUF4408 domain-containing protein n=1 Tax=Clitoria ternatea TaxID=43366 RepID=A0AAN9EX74_CLITE